MQSWQEKNATNYWCEYCKQFVRNSGGERKKHESSEKHKDRVTNFAKNNQKQQGIRNRETLKEQPIVKKFNFSSNTSVEKRKQAIQRQEQFDNLYSKGKHNQTNVVDIPIELLVENDEIDQEKNFENQFIETDPSLKEIKKKVEEYEDNYYDNPDFFYGEEADDVDLEKLKQEEDELKKKIAQAKRDEEIRVEDERIRVQREIDEKEYQKTLDKSSGLSKWEDVEEIEVSGIEEKESGVIEALPIPTDVHANENPKIRSVNQIQQELYQEHEVVRPNIQVYTHASGSTAKKRKLDLLNDLLN